MKQVLPLDPATYEKHFIHGSDRIWTETNCYVDVLVEQLHSLGFEPAAALAFTLPIDYEGDQWTFFKFPHEDLFALYGIQIQEFNPWRSLLEHLSIQINNNRPVLIEMDSYFLPDTAGTAYKISHVKSTISVNKLDIENKILGYFHNQGYFELYDQDFTDIFQMNGLVHERMLPTYMEYIKLNRNVLAPQGEAFVAVSVGQLKKHLQLIPKQNPFLRFKDAFAKDLEWLFTQEIESFHLYSFATLRQYGACFELMATYLTWLKEKNQPHLDIAIENFTAISVATKAFQFQVARAVARKRTIELAHFDEMATLWQTAMNSLAKHYGS